MKAVIVATDLGGLTDTIRVTIPIEHNQVTPQLLRQTYERTINENFPVGDSVEQIQASDNDRLVCNKRTLSKISFVLNFFDKLRVCQL